MLCLPPVAKIRDRSILSAYFVVDLTALFQVMLLNHIQERSKRDLRSSFNE